MELRELRKKKGLRLVDVAKKLKVYASAVSQWERGINGITNKYIKPLAKLYGVTEADIRAASEAIQAARAGKEGK